MKRTKRKEAVKTREGGFEPKVLRSGGVKMHLLQEGRRHPQGKRGRKGGGAKKKNAGETLEGGEI